MEKETPPPIVNNSDNPSYYELRTQETSAINEYIKKNGATLIPTHGTASKTLYNSRRSWGFKVRAGGVVETHRLPISKEERRKRKRAAEIEAYLDQYWWVHEYLDKKQQILYWFILKRLSVRLVAQKCRVSPAYVSKIKKKFMKKTLPGLFPSNSSLTKSSIQSQVKQYFFERKTQSQIAELNDISQQAVSKTIRRYRKKLEEKIVPEVVFRQISL